MGKQVIEVEIERIVAGGHGLARTDEGTLLVRGGLPGERVRVRPSRARGVLHGFAIEVLEPHPGRVDLPLPPGADLPLAYAEQLPIKQALVEEALTRIAKLDAAVEPIAPSPRELGYRTAAQYAVARGGGLGARALSSDRIVHVAEDPLVAEPIARLFAAASARALPGIAEVSFRGSIHAGTALVGLHGLAKSARRIARALSDSGAAGVVWAETDERGRYRGQTRVLAGADRLLEDFGGLLTTVTLRSFAQVNPLAAGALYSEARAIAGSGTRALDLYAGSGVLGLHLAETFDEVVAIEITPDGVRRGEADARRLGRAVTFHRGDTRIAAKHLPADLVALDPPRAGLMPEVTDTLLAAHPGRILYVSCDPSTWARDVARLVAGGYRLSFVRPYDFYPYTHHVEVLSLLERA